MKITLGKSLRPYEGEVVSGDIATAYELEGVLVISLIDVLGHGPEAHKEALFWKKRFMLRRFLTRSS